MIQATVRPIREQEWGMAIPLDPAQLLAFRVERHNLGRRRDRDALIAVCGACGIEDSPPGSAAISLAARIDAFEATDLERALRTTKSLAKIWSVRAAPYVVPTEDSWVFTTGLRPEDEAARHAFIEGAAAHLGLFGLTATEVVELTRLALMRVLDGRDLTKDELGRELAAAVELAIDEALRARWNEPDGLRDNRYGESICRWALDVVALDGAFVLGSNGRATTFLRADQWLGRPLPTAEPRRARAALVTRYLRCYGPSDPRGFAAWAGAAPEQADATWALVRDSLEEVSVGGRVRWLLREDLGAVMSPPTPIGVRLLPPHDPYLQQRDRAELVSDSRRRRQVWRPQGSPGVILVDGVIVGTWRPRKRGSRLEVSVDPFEDLSAATRHEIDAEARIVGRVRGVETVEVTSQSW